MPLRRGESPASSFLTQLFECAVSGRETFLAGIDWTDDWPVVMEDRDEVPDGQHSLTDSFSGGTLDPRCVSPGYGLDAHLAFLGDGVRFISGDRAGDPMHILAVRTRDDHWSAEADLELDTAVVAGVSLRLDGDHRAEVVVDATSIRSVVRIGPASRTREYDRVPGDAVTLCIRAVPADAERFNQGPDDLELSVLVAGERIVLDTIDRRYLSTEVAGGFGGRVVGVRSIAGDPVVREFRYRADIDASS